MRQRILALLMAAALLCAVGLVYTTVRIRRAED